MKPRKISKFITRWSQKELDKVAELYKNDVPAGQIAFQLNVIFHKNQPVRTTDQINYALKRAVKKCGLIRNTRRADWTDTELSYMYSLYMGILTYGEVAAELNKVFHENKPVRTASSVGYAVSLFHFRGLDIPKRRDIINE